MAFEWTAAATVVTAVTLAVITGAAAAFYYWRRRLRCNEEPLLPAAEQRAISIDVSPRLADAETRVGAISQPVQHIASVEQTLASTERTQAAAHIMNGPESITCSSVIPNPAKPNAGNEPTAASSREPVQLQDAPDRAATLGQPSGSVQLLQRRPVSSNGSGRPGSDLLDHPPHRRLRKHVRRELLLDFGVSRASESEAVFIGKRTVDRCRAALADHERLHNPWKVKALLRCARPRGVEAIVKLSPRKRLRLLFRFAQWAFHDDHGDTALLTSERCLMQIGRIQTLVSMALNVNRALDAITAQSQHQTGWLSHLSEEVSSQVRDLSQLLDAFAAAEESSDAFRAQERLSDNSSIVMALVYELQEPDNAVAAMFPAVMPLVRRGFALATTQGAAICPISRPVWFDPCLMLRKDTEYDPDADKNQDAWRLDFTDVSVSSISYDASVSQEKCIRQATLWDKLRHPNVLALIAASFIGTPCFVYARGTSLDEFLRPSPRTRIATTLRAKERLRFKWTRLHEAALGLQYLHSRDIAFIALTIQDLLVVNTPGRDGGERNKVTCQVNCAHAAALRWPDEAVPQFQGDPSWLAPERRKGGPVSLEADVFSFGVCILHAWTGEAPTAGRPGCNPSGSIDDDAKREDTSNVGVPGVAASSDPQVRELVRNMCAQDPEDRVSIAHVVQQLQRLAESEAAGDGTDDHPAMKATKTSSRVRLTSLSPRAGRGLGADLSYARWRFDHFSDRKPCDFLVLYRSVLDRVERIASNTRVNAGGRIASDAGEQLTHVVSHLNMLLLPASRSPIASSSSLSSSISRSSTAQDKSAVAWRRVLDTFRSLHRQLDQVVAALDAVHQRASVHSKWRMMPFAHANWRPRDIGNLELLPSGAGGDDELDRARADQLMQRRVGEEGPCAILPMQTAMTEQPNMQDAEEQLVILSFELQHHASSYAPSVLSDMHAAISQLEQRVGPGSLPSWFLPAYEVEFVGRHAFAEGSFGSVFRGWWLDTDVVVKKVFASGDSECDDCHDDKADRDVFEREASIWSSLKHKNVVELYGACHLRGQRFFVCEFAPFGTLDAFLRSRRRPEGTDADNRTNVWQLLYGVACGLEYLHSQGIAHGDLKCNNVLIGFDETPKLTDFGLSEANKFFSRTSDGAAGVHEADKPAGAVGAYRWKAPEVLRGDVSTSCEADVFSFGMVVVEAVTGELPWGRYLPDAAVKFHVKNGELPSRPRRTSRGVRSGIARGVFEEEAAEEFADDEWELVLELCRFAPTARLPLHEAIARLLQFALRRTHSELQA